MITEELLKQLHKTSIEKLPVFDRHSHLMKCSCGVEGRFFSEEDAKRYENYHLQNKMRAPY